ncbi:MAG: hypothetical protein LUC26_00305 [Prevotella sp.]|nr:hypothetical protein [Prevotella sp.]
MKKVLLFALLACATLAAKAQTSYSLYIDTYPWNYSAAISGKVVVDFGSQWGEFKLTETNTVDASVYTGYKIVVSDVTEDGVQLVAVGADDESYTDISAGTIEGTFSEDLTQFELQGKVADATITVEEAYLIKADGTEEAMVYGGASWGCTFDAYEPAAITYTGQYGGVYIFNPETDEPFTYTYGSDETYNFTITLKDALPADITVELDDASEGFAWITLEAGNTQYTFTINDAACVDGDGTGHDIAHIYLKANEEDGYPFTVNYKSIIEGATDEESTDEEDTDEEDASDYFVSLDFEGDNSYWTLYDNDAFEISNDTNVTPGMDGNHFLANYGNNFYASTDLIHQTSQSELPAGTYTVSARINVGGNMDDIEFYATAGETDEYLSMAYDSADWTAEDRVSVEITLDEDAYLTIGIRTGADYPTAEWLWLIADNFDVEGTTSGEETGITSVPAVTAAGNGAIYNIAGQRVNENAKGLLIKDGKKVLVK